MDLGLVAFGLMTSHGISHLVSIGVVGVRLLRREERLAPGAERPPVTLLRPVRGLENYIEASLRTTFTLDYPALEVIFCVDEEDDPVVPLVRRLIAEHPTVNAKLLVGRDRIGDNPKINNLVKGWNAATADWVILSDSNALLPPDFVELLLARVRPDIGLVSTPASLSHPETFAAEVECAVINTLQGRWMMLADSAGFGFAQGRTVMLRRSTLAKVGGLRALTLEAADELAATRAVRRVGLKPRLTRRPVPQAIGRRAFGTVWRRQLRWARLRRVGLLAMYPAEIFVGAAVPFACAAALVLAGRMPVVGLLAYMAAWYGLEALFSRIGGWYLSPRMPLAWLVRDLLLPVIWVAGWVGTRVEWRGHAVTVTTPAEATPPANEDRP